MLHTPCPSQTLLLDPRHLDPRHQVGLQQPLLLSLQPSQAAACLQGLFLLWDGFVPVLWSAAASPGGLAEEMSVVLPWGLAGSGTVCPFLQNKPWPVPHPGEQETPSPLQCSMAPAQCSHP